MTDNNEVRGKAVKKYVSTSSHGGMVAVVSNDYSGTYVSHDDYAALQAEADALRDMNRRQARRVMEQESARIAAEARANRLADAGRRVTAAFRAHGEATPYTRNEDQTRHECEAAMLALDAALEQEGKRDE